MPRRPGQPTKFTEDRIERFLKATSLGAKREIAAGAAGWSVASACNYLARGQDAQDILDTGATLTTEQAKYLEFLERTKEAESKHAEAALSVIIRAAQTGTWQAAAWLLERGYPSLYGRTIQEHQGADGGPIKVSQEAESLLQMLDSLGDRKNGKKADA